MTILETYLLKLYKEKKQDIVNEQFTEAILLYLAYKKIEKTFSKCRRKCYKLKDKSRKPACKFRCDLSRAKREVAYFELAIRKTKNPVKKKFYETQLKIAQRNLGILIGTVEKFRLASLQKPIVNVINKFNQQ